MGIKDEDFVENLFTASTHQTLLFFTDAGKVYWLKVHEIPEAGRAAKGKALVNLLALAGGEKVTATLPDWLMGSWNPTEAIDIPRNGLFVMGLAVLPSANPVIVGAQVQLRDIFRSRSLWLAANWFKFPRANAAPGMVAVRKHHVFVIRQVVGQNTVLAYDANSGGRKTRLHVRSLSGFTVVNPHGGKYTS